MTNFKRPHNVEVKTVGIGNHASGRRYRAACSCTWYGRSRDTWEDANKDAVEHKAAAEDAQDRAQN